ncbi:MAG: DUF3298 and DUF4163 domain-containing protein [Clostridium butyricum]
MKLSTTFMGMFIIGSMLCTGYKQNLYTTCELYFNNVITLVEKSINKDVKYLKEDLRIPQFNNGKNPDNIKIINIKINNDIFPKVNEAEQTASEYYGDLHVEKPQFPFEIYSRYTVTINNNSIISLYNDYYEFLGGAHGLTIRTSYTVDKEAEKLLNLKELFTSDYDYKSIINDEIKKQIAAEPDKYFESADNFKGIGDSQNFYISGKNLIIYYQQYEIAPYVAGIPEFNIPLEKFGSDYKYANSKI